MILFLDDNPNRAALAYKRWSKEKRDQTIWTTTAQEAIDVLKDYDLEEAHLDHDLGGEHFVNSAREDCGMEVVRWMERQQIRRDVKRWQKTHFIVHTWNIPAGVEMEQRLKRMGLKVTRVPFGMG